MAWVDRQYHSIRAVSMALIALLSIVLFLNLEHQSWRYFVAASATYWFIGIWITTKGMIAVSRRRLVNQIIKAGIWPLIIFKKEMDGAKSVVLVANGVPVYTTSYEQYLEIRRKQLASPTLFFRQIRNIVNSLALGAASSVVITASLIWGGVIAYSVVKGTDVQASIDLLNSIQPANWVLLYGAFFLVTTKAFLRNVWLDEIKTVLRLEAKEPVVGELTLLFTY